MSIEFKEQLESRCKALGDAVMEIDALLESRCKDIQQLESRYAELEDCAQEGVCRGCIRHFGERNRELLARVAELEGLCEKSAEIEDRQRARIKELESRVAELHRASCCLRCGGPQGTVRHFCTQEQRAVLDAMAAVPRDTLERSLSNRTHGSEHSRAPARAELARRESTK